VERWEEGGYPAYRRGVPWWPYYPVVYSPVWLPGWTSMHILLVWESVLALLARWVHREEPPGSRREKPMGGSLLPTLKS